MGNSEVATEFMGRGRIQFDGLAILAVKVSESVEVLFSRYRSSYGTVFDSEIAGPVRTKLYDITLCLLCYVILYHTL